MYIPLLALIRKMTVPETITELKKSPLFNLSLSSKELFHSNFIAWICENYQISFGEILANHFAEKFNFSDKKIISVQRETRNLDLTIEFNQIKIIVENKVKSVPDRQQLIDYKGKSNSNNIFVLLTIIKPSFELKDLGWELLTYRDLGILLSNLIDRITDDYHKKIIKDYIYFINNLSDLLKPLSLNIEKSYYNFYGSDYKLFKEIRLHDLYIKYNYAELVKEIEKYLKSNLTSKEVKIGKRYSLETNRNKVVISTTLVNGKGIINIDFSDQDEIIYGIMLDGGRYNHYLDAWGEKEKEKIGIADNLQLNKKWFLFDFVNENEVYPKNGKNYNRFGKSMIYRSIKLNNDTLLSILLERILKDVNKLTEISTNAVYN